MLWGSIKAAGFVGLAVATGVVCTSVPLGGKTLAARLGELSPPAPAPRRAVSEAGGKAHREAEPAEAPTPTPGPRASLDPRAVAKVLPDEQVGDSLRPEERQAISQLIQQKARQAKPPRHP